MLNFGAMQPVPTAGEVRSGAEGLSARSGAAILLSVFQRPLQRGTEGEG